MTAGRGDAATECPFPLTFLGPTADSELTGRSASPMTVACETSWNPGWWRCWKPRCGGKIRDPEYLLGALKVYYMMTGLAPYDREFVASWWQDQLPLHMRHLDPFPTEAAWNTSWPPSTGWGRRNRIAPDNDWCGGPAIASAPSRWPPAPMGR